MKRRFYSVKKILISLLLATIYMFTLPITPNLAASLSQDMDNSPLADQNWAGEQKNLASFSVSEKSSSGAGELLTDPQQADQCLVPPSMYTFTFGDFSEDTGKTAWYCQTKSYQVANLTNDPIEIYYRVIFQNLNGSDLIWSQIFLQPGESFSANAFFNSGRGGASNSLVEYNLPVDMVALYGTEECRKNDSSNMQEPPPFAIQQTVPLSHPCPGPDGAGGLTPGGVPLYEQGGLPVEKTPEATGSVAQNEQPAGDLELSSEQQIAELLIYQEEDRLDQWPGWSGLNDNQRQALLRILERVKHMQYLTEYFLTDLDVEALANEPLSPEQQLLMDEDTRQRFINERKKDEAEQRLSDYYQNIDRVELMLNRERLRARFGDQALWLYDQYRASELISGAVDRVKNFYDHLVGGKNVAQEQIEDAVKSSLGVPVDEAIKSVLRATVRTANDPGLVHYGYYAERYKSYTSSGMAADQAHSNALKDLKDMLINPDIDFLLADSDRLGEYWNYDNFRDQVKPGGLYDVVFQQLGGGYDVGVNR